MTYVCKDCKETFPNLREYSMHMQLHEEPPVNPKKKAKKSKGFFSSLLHKIRTEVKVEMAKDKDVKEETPKDVEAQKAEDITNELEKDNKLFDIQVSLSRITTTLDDMNARVSDLERERGGKEEEHAVLPSTTIPTVEEAPSSLPSLQPLPASVPAPQTKVVMCVSQDMTSAQIVQLNESVKSVTGIVPELRILN